jgi:hypothetical protein
MTQRVARPMKFAAFISIIISVAVLFTACQGAVGPQGPPGADGADGTTGTPGGDGTSALIAIGGELLADAASTWVNDKHELVATTLTPMLGDIPGPIDVSMGFGGGNGEITYAIGDTMDDQYYTATLADGMVTLTKRAAAADPNNDDGLVLSSFSITATDELKLSAKKYFRVLRNVAPDGILPALDPIIIGTQAVENPKNTDENENNDEDHIPMLNQFVITVVADESGGTHFDDADPDNLTVTAKSSDESIVSVAYDGKEVTLTGHKATATAIDETPAAPVTITITAVDSGGLESIEKLTASVTVTAEPVVDPDRSLVSSLTLTKGTESVVLVSDIAEYFKPAMGLIITAKAVPDNIVELSAAATAEAGIQDNLLGTPKNVGTAVITVKAADAIGQSITRTISVTVKVE